MASISLKIAYPIILAGLFIMAIFVALNYQTLSNSFYIVLVFLVLYVFLFGFATGQNFAIPVKRLLQKADDLSRGDMKARFYSEGKEELGELGDLGRAFNKIAEGFEESKAEAAILEKSVDIKVRARTESLEETIRALEQKVKNRTLELQRVAEDLKKIQMTVKK